ncbi:uncharacterized protein N7500_009360 [Penicillium coprophilum]|uniref:uncharacterized protein n=1 Tax=Penicillium coprophilum TaxID=36646 RepID=UPI00238D363D|nr:uncharacterized protein N7500_009360 [Penicillium coprophilum]KAJ5153921.1 hypothetical protein N7500_009360 [Penicillium coprophilum]
MDQHLEPHQRATTPHDHSVHENRNIHSSARSNSSNQLTESHPNSAPASVNPEYENEEDTIDSSNLDGDTAADRPSSNWDSAVLDTWLYELCALVFSLACFIAIIAVLWAYDQKSTPTMWQGLTLNTIVSILATASKSSLIFVVGDAIV